jgi:hypothetical protein
MIGKQDARFAIVLVIVGLGGGRSAAADSGVVVHPALGGEVNAWPFGFVVEGGVWLDKGLFMGSAHVRLGALAHHPDPSGRNYGAYLGSYGVQVGGAVPWGSIQPFVLVGYERLGTVSADTEGGSGSGRTEQNLNLELGVRLLETKLDVLIGFRASQAVASGSSYPAGPPPPRAAFVATLRL